MGMYYCMRKEIPTKGCHRVGKETQNRNKFNDSYFRPHSLFSTPLPFAPPPPFFLFLLPRVPRIVSSTSLPLYPFIPMLLPSFAFLIYASAAALVQGQTQTVYNTAHNVTSISGTWSSGSGNVTTGPVRMFVRLLWHSLIRGNWCRLMYFLPTKASVTPQIRACRIHCASISLFFFESRRF